MLSDKTLECARLMGGLTRKSAVDYAKDADADTVIAYSVFFPPWVPRGTYAVGDMVMWDGQPRTCREAYDADIHPDWNPTTYAAGWSYWHATSPELAMRLVIASWSPYQPGEYATWGDEDHPDATYKCLKPNTVHTPGELPTAWEVHAPESAAPEEVAPEDEGSVPEESAQEWPKWVQGVPGDPTKPGYAKDAQASHAGARWTCTQVGSDGLNWYAPDAWGWTESTE